MAKAIAIVHQSIRRKSGGGGAGAGGGEAILAAGILAGLAGAGLFLRFIIYTHLSMSHQIDPEGGHFV
jgi:hypothetical protein